jgi:hypothetical protein
MMLSSVEFVLPGAVEAGAFMTDVWGLTLAEARDHANYLRGSGSFPYIFSLEEGPALRPGRAGPLGSREDLPLQARMDAVLAPSA